MQNLMLMGEALGLGGWVHGSIMPPYCWQRDESKGFLGLGFREHGPKPATTRFRRWPPLPASLPNFVGIDGVLEGLCPPYVSRWTRRSTACMEWKFGPDGVTGTEMSSRAPTGRPRRPRRISRTRRRTPRGRRVHEGDLQVRRTRRYGRFPAHVNSFYCPGMWIQFAHLELEYYEQFADPEHARRAAEGRELWRSFVSGTRTSAG